MGKLSEIEQKLLSGSTTNQLIEQGYAKSSVHLVANKLKNLKPDTPVSPIPDEIQELRHRREIIKLQKEIAELEAAKERLPDRVTKTEAELLDLRENLVDIWAIDMCAVLKRMECPKHGKAMGIVVQCRECTYTLGFGWKDST
jgi:chromosome segregation ATPase